MYVCVCGACTAGSLVVGGSVAKRQPGDGVYGCDGENMNLRKGERRVSMNSNMSSYSHIYNHTYVTLIG